MKTSDRSAPELLSPAGNFEKMEAAIRYGANAVYLAGHAFGMRSAADNFSDEELAAAIAYAHERGVRVYVTVNTAPRDAEYPALAAYLRRLGELAPDALIVADIGVFSLCRELIPEMELHVSTQANSVSAADVRAWGRLGAKRVVLSRELTLEEIRAIRAAVPLGTELECFIHGSMCISYSGRCLLSNYLCGRDANHGACAQPCRWEYKIRPTSYELIERERPDMPIPIEETAGETFIMSSRDLSMIAHVPELIDAGIASFKIEGRMKSAYYTAVVTNAYRMAIAAALRGETQPDPLWLRELESVSHREYDTGYFFADSRKEALTCRESGYIREKAYLATVLSYDPATGEAKCVQRNKVSVGDPMELLTPGKGGQPLFCTALFDEEHQPIPSTPHPAMIFYLPVPFPVQPGDILRGGEVIPKS
ncbi:MAG: U32 family peptidase [Eubacteriales bacterium]|nr:U32 family peptidase [Eubacteriales bacterium]